MNRGRTRNGGRQSTPIGRGRSARPAGGLVYRPVPARVDGSNSNVSSGNKDGEFHNLRQPSRQMSVGSISKQFNRLSTSDSLYQQDWPLPGTMDISSDPGKLNLVENTYEAVGPSSNQLVCLSASAFEKGAPSLSVQSDPGEKDLAGRRIHRREMLDAEVDSVCTLHFDHSPAFVDANVDDSSSLHLDQSPVLDNFLKLAEPTSLPFVESGTKDMASGKGSQCGQSPRKESAASIHTETSDCQAARVPFDICPVRSGNVVMLKAPLHVQNRIKRNEAKHSIEGKKISVLRSGMFLLKRHITSSDQVKIVKICRDLALGSGGFYDPAYRDGGKLHLKMMCLGRNWDPETSKYVDKRPIDGAKPPSIPTEFCQLVKGAIQACHSSLREASKTPNVENELPSMSPNICIVNFYTKSGRLGLHQDKDESTESLQRGLPVVSFSVGDSAEFLYGDKRDIERAEKVILESGDVLVFGGRSRHVFHGVTAILPDTAPKTLQEETNLLPGRLNLTFREY